MHYRSLFFFEYYFYTTACYTQIFAPYELWSGVYHNSVENNNTVSLHEET